MSTEQVACIDSTLAKLLLLWRVEVREKVQDGSEGSGRFGGSVIPFPVSDDQIFGFHKLNLDLPELAVAGLSGRNVSEIVETAELFIDQRKGVVQLLGRVGEEHLAAGFDSELLEYALSPAVSAGTDFVGTDRINRDVVFLHEPEGLPVERLLSRSAPSEMTMAVFRRAGTFSLSRATM